LRTSVGLTDSPAELQILIAERLRQYSRRPQLLSDRNRISGLQTIRWDQEGTDEKDDAVGKGSMTKDNKSKKKMKKGNI
jgi:hypothetical protein